MHADTGGDGDTAFATAALRAALASAEHRVPKSVDGLVFAAQKTVRVVTKAATDWKTNGMSVDAIEKELAAYEEAIGALVEELQHADPYGCGQQLTLRLASAFYTASCSATGIGIARRAAAAAAANTAH